MAFRNVGNSRDWLSVIVLAVFWGLSMIALAYIRRRRRRTPGLRRLPVRTLMGSFLFVTFVSFDFGFLTTFWTRSFHGDLLVVLVAVNVALVLTVFAFRLLRR